MDSQHQQYPTDSVQQPVPKILPAAEFFFNCAKKTSCRANCVFSCDGEQHVPAFPRGKGFRLHTPLFLRDD